MNNILMSLEEENAQASAREVLIPLLHPGERLKIALSGPTIGIDTLSLVDIVLSLIAGSAPTTSTRTTYLGITNDEMVFAVTRNPKKPSQLQRVSLGNVSIVKFKEHDTSLLLDELVIDTGTAKPLRLATAPVLRTVIRKLASVLSRPVSQAYPGES